MGLSCRALLLQPTGAGSGSAAGRETLRTAELDNRGLVQLQQTVMREQDSELEELERSVTSTKVSCPRVEDDARPILLTHVLLLWRTALFWF